MSAEGEIDRIVEAAFFSDPGRHGVMVEVGAAHPVYLSIGKRFRDRGWQVIAVEPIPEFCDAHRTLGHDVLQYACSDRDDDDASFSVVRTHGTYHGGQVTFESISSLGPRDEFAEQASSIAAETSQIPVKVRRLDRLLRDHAPAVGTIDILSIDVEGWEIEVLEGLSLARYAPEVVILENNFRKPEQRAYMTSRGYINWATLHPNEIFVRPAFVEDTCDALYGASPRPGRWF